MKNKLNIIMAQLNFHVGDIEGNAKKIIQKTKEAKEFYQGDLILFSELAITGYSPEDLLYRKELYERIHAVLPTICEQADGISIIVGYPEKIKNRIYNRAAFIQDGKIVATYDKQKLPNYSVFDEKRYFVPGRETVCVVELKGIKLGITICEDLWYAKPAANAKIKGAQLLLSLNASPFQEDKAKLRQKILTKRIQENQLPIIYLNTVGGQDELVFDGGSMVLNAEGTLVQRAKFFEEELIKVEIVSDHDNNIEIIPKSIEPMLSQEALIYNALVLGVRDYIEKNNFPMAVLGLSGGADSALTLAIAVDAIGKDRVEVLLMPSRYTSDMSNEDAIAQAKNLGVNYSIISIEPIFQSFLGALKKEFENLPTDITEENLQARCRGTLLMAVSNKKNAVVLATGNKSETATGYSTLYGDMVGGFCVLKDVFKTMVYRLAHYRNTLSPIIPDRVLQRPPSAELAENQKDEDTLPPYSILDEILRRYIECDESAKVIIHAGFDPEIVTKVLRMVNRNEYKRRQSAPGIRITSRAFGKDRRYPITSRFA